MVDNFLNNGAEEKVQKEENKKAQVAGWGYDENAKNQQRDVSKRNNYM
ncbi:MAG: hypothetical protein K2G55_16440 [Lachnospiraceae bacterium]|nr:hypothetical protein [Lachnospiraceae bacterium]MDE7201291.1 hypothetical protein [Lachnospiraceae bacterium]